MHDDFPIREVSPRARARHDACVWAARGLLCRARVRRFFLLVPVLAACSLFQRQDPQQAQANAMAQSQAAFVKANSAQFAHTQAEREAFIAEHTASYAAAGEPIAGTLESFAQVPVKLERGKCYMMVFRLDPAAKFSTHAQAGISFIYHTTSGVEINGGPGIHGAGGLGSGGCPLESSDAQFDVQAYLGSATDKSRIHELGTGAYSLQLMTKTITEEELAALEADRQRQLEESERFEREQTAKACVVCRDEYLECLAEGGEKYSCQNRRDSCVSRHYGGPSYSASCQGG